MVKKIYQNPYIIFSIYILSSFLIDILTTLTSEFTLSIGIILRGILLLYVLIGLIVKCNSKFNRFVVMILTLFSTIFLIFHHRFIDISYLFKFNFLILIFTFIVTLYKKEDKKINRNILTISLLLYSLTIILTWVYTLVFNKDINVSVLFSSTNEVSTIITIILPYLFVNLEKRINPIEIFTIILAVFSAFLLGTRLPIAVFLFCILYLLIKKLIKDIKIKKINYVNLILFLIFLGCFIYKFQATPLYKNLYNRVEYLNISKPLDAVKDFKSVDQFIFNKRLTYLKNNNKLITKANISNKLIGLGYTKKMVEMDLFDIFYQFGIIGFIIFALIYAKLLATIKTKKSIKTLPIVVIVITSLLSGHILLSPSVSLVMMVIVANILYKKKKKKIFIASYNMGIGGIETASFNLIKNLNTKENEITLYLEKKEGHLLKDLPSNVIVKRQKVFDNKIFIIRKTLNMLNKLKFLLTNYKEYEFSCCYATYSMSSNFLARHASNNSAFYVHGDYNAIYNNDINKINNFFGPRKLDKFKHIVFVSNEAKDSLTSIYPRFLDKAIVINNFIDEEKIISLSKKEVKEKKPQKKKLFLFVGRIDNGSKNLVRMVNAFALAHEKCKNIELWIIGSGPDEDLIKKQITDKGMEKVIKMLGARTNPYPYFKMCDYVLLTSNYEGFPVVYGEAITLKKQIITTIDVSDESISIPNNFGYITKKNEEDIANTIVKVVSNNKLKYKSVSIKEINQKKINLLNSIIKSK